MRLAHSIDDSSEHPTSGQTSLGRLKRPVTVLLDLSLAAGAITSFSYGAALASTSVLGGALVAGVSVRAMADGNPASDHGATTSAAMEEDFGKAIERGGLLMILSAGLCLPLLRHMPKNDLERMRDRADEYDNGRRAAIAEKTLEYIEEHRSELANTLGSRRRASIPPLELGGWYGSADPAEIRLVPERPPYSGDGTRQLGLHTPDTVRIHSLPRLRRETSCYEA